MSNRMMNTHKNILKVIKNYYSILIKKIDIYVI